MTCRTLVGNLEHLSNKQSPQPLGALSGLKPAPHRMGLPEMFGRGHSVGVPRAGKGSVRAGGRLLVQSFWNPTGELDKRPLPTGRSGHRQPTPFSASFRCSLKLSVSSRLSLRVLGRSYHGSYCD